MMSQFENCLEVEVHQNDCSKISCVKRKELDKVNVSGMGLHFVHVFWSISSTLY